MICEPVDVFPIAATADLPYAMDATDWLEGASIASVAWAVSNALLAVHTPTNTATVASVWVQGQDAGEGTTFVTATITADDGKVGVFAWRFDVCG